MGGRLYLALGALGVPMARWGGSSSGKGSRGFGASLLPLSSCLLGAESKRCFPSILFVCLLPFPSLPSATEVYSQGTWFLQLQRLLPGRPPTRALTPPPPLPGRLCWLSAGPAAAFTAIPGHRCQLPRLFHGLVHPL